MVFAEWLGMESDLPFFKRLRQFTKMWDGTRNSLLEVPPFTLSHEQDLWIAALAEHLCHLIHQEAPEWTFSLPPMKKASFPGGFSLRALGESPVAFRRRMIFVSKLDFPELFVLPTIIERRPSLL